ncbi:MAG TPA: methyltransferase domain-containing protein [Cellvibrio sp.]|nr:methyltransferase domain-containing protein [Cellvibrio sp.]
MARQPLDGDRNFDDLAGRFKKNIYGGLKGDIRLAVLNRDFHQHIPIAPFAPEKAVKPLRILDAGGGQGQFSLAFAEAGHQLVICDISAEMLKLAEAEVAHKSLAGRVTLLHCAIQDLPAHLSDAHQGFDLVLCHAVIEWMLEPQTLLPCLLDYLRPEGYLSFTFYNLNSLVYKNLLRTNFKKILQQDFAGSRGSLTPINPMEPAVIDRWLADLPLSILGRSGIRVFHDYIFDHENREREPETVIALELQYSLQEPFLSLGRYIHILAVKRWELAAC